MTIKTLDSTASELRQAIATVKGGRRNTPVPTELRGRALQVVEAGRARGTSMRQMAATLGVHESTLMNWRRDAASSTPFVEARVVVEREGDREVVGPPPAERRVRVAVIDGLDVTTLAALLRSMW
jgi:transposase-like protein